LQISRVLLVGECNRLFRFVSLLVARQGITTQTSGEGQRADDKPNQLAPG
jgi:hypothetical protein